jgi:TrmH family RNA methyltransferase
VGAIIKTSAAMAAGGMVLVNTQFLNPFDRRVIRASRGCLFGLPIVTTTAEKLVEFCATHHLTLVVTKPGTDHRLEELSPADPAAIALGAERTGCSRVLADAATLRVTIPTDGGVESLNVAAAAAIALYSRYRFNSTRLRNDERAPHADPPHQTHQRAPSS